VVFTEVSYRSLPAIRSVVDPKSRGVKPTPVRPARVSVVTGVPASLDRFR